jgi:hypothetical protein
MYTFKSLSEFIIGEDNMSRLNITSDFKDYYDLESADALVTYTRMLSDSKQRGIDLRYLRSIGVKTIEIKQVNQFVNDGGKLVVYTDPNKHGGKGKKILSVDEARQSYSNYIASKLYNVTTTLKYLQVGKRRFKILFERDTFESLDAGKIVSVTELSNEYNRIIGLPIFSIDYIHDGIETIATDYNIVEDLSKLGFEAYMSSEEVRNEIYESLIVYNKY